MIDFYFWTTPNGYKVLMFLEETGIPYQTLINLYLRDCAARGRKLSMQWRKESQTGAA